jgi:hypothetical protein
MFLPKHLTKWLIFWKHQKSSTDIFFTLGPFQS